MSPLNPPGSVSEKTDRPPRRYVEEAALLSCLMEEEKPYEWSAGVALN